MSVQTTREVSREEAESKAIERMKFTLLPIVKAMSDEELEDYIEEEFDNYMIIYS